MSEGKDLRLYDAAKKLCDCWADHIGPAPKQAWYDGHQQMEQGLVRFGRFVNEIERKPGPSTGPGDRYIALAKFLLDCRKDGTEYDQSHLPVQQQYEAVGHAVRAVYTYSGMADVAVETHDVDYQSATKSIWDNLVNKKYYLTGGVGAVRRRKDSDRTTRCATTATARHAPAAARSSSSGSCTSRITTRSTPTSTSRPCTTRSTARWTWRARTSTTTTRSTRTRRATRGTTARAASATSRARC
jgi:hypothetical protein